MSSYVIIDRPNASPLQGDPTAGIFQERSTGFDHTPFGWLLAMQIRIGAGVLLDPIINYLYTVGGLWEVFWLNVVKTPVTLTVLAIVQLLVLRRSGTHAGWWVFANGVGGILNGAIGATTCAKVCSILAVGVGLGISQGLGWLAYGVVTGVVLIPFLALPNK